MLGQPGIADIARLKKRRAAEIVARRIDRPPGRECGDNIRRTVAQRVIAHVVSLRIEEEKPAEVVAAEAAAPAEPEVIKKGKKEEEGEEGAVAEEKPEKPERPEKSKK